MNSLAIKSITKRFDGVVAVDGLSLTFAVGEVIGVIGPNGSGKSTLINLITGLLSFDSGVVAVGKRQKKRVLPYEVAGLGMTRTFQEVRLFLQMSVWENIMVVLSRRNVLESLFGRDSSESQRIARETLERVGLWNKREAKAETLSYGQRKLLEIARVMCMDSEIVFLDEPFAGLFHEMVERIIGIIFEMRRAGKTVILVEHNMKIIQRLVDCVYVLDGGQLLASGTVAKILKNKKVREAYFGK